MSDPNSIQEIFFKFLMQYRFSEEDLDYAVLPGHISTLQTLSAIGNSGITVFDFNKKISVFYSCNYGSLLGYESTDYENRNYQFFEEKIHPEDRYALAMNSISTLKLFNSFSSDEKLNHKFINEYRMLNAAGKYMRLVEQHQVLELDKKGQIWLTLNIADISPDQEENGPVKSQLLNFRTGSIIPFETAKKAEIELTRREIEVLKLVREGHLSKEISDKLSISVHTVNTLRQRFLEKLGANNSLEAVMFATRFGLLD